MVDAPGNLAQVSTTFGPPGQHYPQPLERKHQQYQQKQHEQHSQKQVWDPASLREHLAACFAAGVEAVDSSCREDMEFLMPDIAFSVRGRSAFKEFLTCVSTSTGGEAQLQVLEVRHAGELQFELDVLLAGLPRESPLPFFPRGVQSCWKFAACAKFGHDGRLAALSMRLSLDEHTALTPVAVQGLAEQAERMACTFFGCRTLQLVMASQNVSHEQRAALMPTQQVRALLASPRGSFVVQAFVEATPWEYSGCVTEALRGNAVELAKHPSHSRILERLLDRATAARAVELIDELVDHFAALARHDYGNFVLQQALRVCSPSQRQRINAALVASIHSLAVDQVANNVVRVALSTGTSEDRSIIADALMADSAAFRRISRSQRGSWVAKEAKNFVRERKAASEASTTYASSSAQTSPRSSAGEPSFDAMHFLGSLSPCSLPQSASELEALLQAAVPDVYED